MKHLICIAVNVACASATLADTLTFAFNGTIEYREGSLPAPFTDVAIGDPFSLSYTFESDAPDLMPDNTNVGCYATTYYQLTVGQASQAGVSEIDSSIFVYVDIQRYGAIFHEDGVTIAGILDFQPETFATDALMTTMNLNALTDALFDFGDTNGYARGRIVEVFLPEPASAVIFIGALLALHRR